MKQTDNSIRCMHEKYKERKEEIYISDNLYKSPNEEINLRIVAKFTFHSSLLKKVELNVDFPKKLHGKLEKAVFMIK